MASLVDHMFEALEEVSVPRQNASMDDLSAYDQYHQGMSSNSLETPFRGLRSSRSDVNLSFRGVFNALDRLNIPPAESFESLVSLSSHYSLESLGEDSVLDESIIRRVYHAMEDAMLPLDTSHGSKGRLLSKSTDNLQIQPEAKESSVIAEYLRFFYERLEEFLEQGSN